MNTRALETSSKVLAAQTGRMIRAAQRILDNADAEGRELSEAETGELDALLESGESALEVAGDARLEAILKARPGRKTEAEQPGGGFGFGSRELLPMRVPPGASYQARVAWAQRTFGLKGELRGFESFGGFLAAVAHSPHDARLTRIQAAASEGVGSEGGFLVPGQQTAQILGGIFVESSIVGRVSVVPMASMTISIAGFDRNNSQSNGAIGGISFNYEPEAGSLTGQTPAIKSLGLRAHKAVAYLPVSNELLSDSPFVSQQLSVVFSEAGRARLELDVINGSGAGQPLGIVNAPSTISQAAEGSQTADTINYENIIKMASRLHPNLWNDAVWIASPTTIPQLLKLLVKVQNVAATENVGGSLYVVETDQAGQFRILGRPVLFSAACPVLGDVGDIILVAPQQYALGLRSALTVESSPHALFSSDQTAFRAIMRHDGQPTWASTLTLPGTATTVSWAVTLAAR